MLKNSVFSLENFEILSLMIVICQSVVSTNISDVVGILMRGLRISLILSVSSLSVKSTDPLILNFDILLALSIDLTFARP